MRKKRNISSALFDVKPLGQPRDSFVVGKLASIVDLRKPTRRSGAQRPYRQKTQNGDMSAQPVSAPRVIAKRTRAVFEATLQSKETVKELLTKVGGAKVLEPKKITGVRTVPIYRGYNGPKALADKSRDRISFGVQTKRTDVAREPVLESLPRMSEEILRGGMHRYRDIEKEAGRFVNTAFLRPSSSVANNLTFALKKYKTLLREPSAVTVARTSRLNLFLQSSHAAWGRRLLIMALVIAIGAGGVRFFHNLSELKNSILAQGNAAYENLDEARTALEQFDFFEAAQNFSLASKNFQQASQELFGFQTSLLGVIERLSGLGKIEGAKNLSEAGKLLADAGALLTNSVVKIQNNNFFSLATTFSDTEGTLTGVNDVIRDFRSSLISADRSLNKASVLLAAVDPSLIPEDKRKTFTEFSAKLPSLVAFVNRSIDYTSVLTDILGQRRPMRYLVLFQNTSELRPTGGFYGSFGIVEFHKGAMKQFSVDDVYRLDGQLKENIIPPKQLQGITATWGMRDANWFADFPTSARKILDFYRRNTGESLDGVIAINTNLILNILSITGPIALEEFNVILDEQNFLSEVQSEIEYGDDRRTPKSILYEFAPLFLQRLSQAGNEDWFSIAQVLMDSLERRDMMAYFIDRDLERFASTNGIDGEIHETRGDYLMVVHSNIKGSKTDRFIKNDLSVETSVDASGTVTHTLTITREHGGGDKAFGFYNRTNYDYVRVYVPLGAEVISISGNDHSPFSPIIDYRYEGGFIEDPDLAALERPVASGNIPEIVEHTRERDKEVFGFWLIVKPKEKKSVIITWNTGKHVRTGEDYELFIQKQPGAISRFRAALNIDKKFTPTAKSPEQLIYVDKKWVFEDILDKDKKIMLKF